MSAIILFINNGKSYDLEVPLDISANDLVTAVNKYFNLGINLKDSRECYLKSEEPLALLKGDKTLEEYGIRTGSLVKHE